MSGYVEYSSNNSGGSWWLDDEDWKKLEAAGWKVQYVWQKSVYKGNKYLLGEDGLPVFEDDDSQKGKRWLGCIAKYAYKANVTLREAADEWEKVIGKSPLDAGCACCGQPHNFTEYDTEQNVVAYGPEAEYVASW